MLLVLQKDVFIENEASQQCVTMRKRFSTIMATIWFNSLLKYLSCRKLKCVTPLQSAITRKREAPQPHVLIFFLIFSSFSIKSIISRGKVFRDDPKKSLFRYILSLVTKHQIWHSWAMIILWDFFVNIFFIFSIFLFLFFILLIFFFFIFIFIFFDGQRWATIHIFFKKIECFGGKLNSL